MEGDVYKVSPVSEHRDKLLVNQLVGSNHFSHTPRLSYKYIFFAEFVIIFNTSWCMGCNMGKMTIKLDQLVKNDEQRKYVAGELTTILMRGGDSKEKVGFGPHLLLFQCQYSRK